MGDGANDGVAVIQTATAKRFLAFPFLLIAGIASVFMSFLGLFAGGWGGARVGSGLGDRILHSCRIASSACIRDGQSLLSIVLLAIASAQSRFTVFRPYFL